MKKLKSILLIILVLSLLVTFGCSPKVEPTQSNGSSSNDSANYEKPKFLTIGTAGVGGAYYPIGIAMAEIIQNSLGISTTAQVTGGAVENNIEVNSQALDIAITQGPPAFAAYNGNPPYKEKQENIMALFSGLSKGVFQVVVKDDASINSIADLKGKKVVMGPAGGGAITVTEEVFSFYDMTLDDITPNYISYTEGIEAFTDNNVDAVIVQSAVPSSAIEQLAAISKDYKLLSIEDDILEQIIEKYPYYGEIALPKDMYNTQEDVKTIYLSNMVVVNKNLSEDLVYDIARVIFDNIDKIRESHPSASGLTLEGAVDSPIPLHPGAERYFKEEGVLK